jgi:eukaryotic-like serine/threonine-protein kinase
MLRGKTIGPFVIDKKIGAGAMGAVYRAKYADSGKWVAIKVVAGAHATNETTLQRFEREWEILKQLKHPNIVRLVASGRYAGTPFYAMEYVEGESLDKIMARRGRIGWEEVVRLGRQLCAGLQHAHEKGIVHRDLKPSNIMILKDGTVKLTDFGIAKDLDRTAITEANSTVGTAAYMSPEQCKGERNLTYKSDLYSMGVMFYELLTGTKPFQAESSLDMFMQHVKGTFERPSRLALDVPIFLDTLVCQLMEKDPARRPLSAAMVAEALERVEEKVAAQQAAGLDAARTTKSDKPPAAAGVDADDTEAVRALLGKKKKKRRREHVAFYQRTWFKAIGLVASLLAIVAVMVVVFFVPPSQESLYKSAEQVMKSDDLELKLTARTSGPLYRYLSYYGDRDDEQTHKIRRWADAVDAEECERWVLKRMRDNINIGGVDKDEEACRDAIEAEDEGALKTARSIWNTLVKYKDEPRKPEPSEKRSYGLLAQTRLDALDNVEKREKTLEKNVTDKGFATGYEPADDYEKSAAKAFQLERQKSPKAAEAWEEFRKKFERDTATTRPWWLLANKHLRGLPATLKKQP